MFEKLMSLPALSGAGVWMRDHHPFDSKVITWYEFIKKMIDKDVLTAKNETKGVRTGAKMKNGVSGVTGVFGSKDQTEQRSTR